MWTIIGFVIVGFIILHKRSTGIITVNPLQARRRGPAPEAEEPQAPSLAGVLGAIKQAAEEAARQDPGGGARLPAGLGREAIIKLVRGGRSIEAVQLYRRFYGVDLKTAKKAVEDLMQER